MTINNWQHYFDIENLKYPCYDFHCEHLHNKVLLSSQVYIDANQDTDDEGLNQLQLLCGNVSTGEIVSILDSMQTTESRPGELSANRTCQQGYHMSTFCLQLEPFNVTQDNVMARCINAYCKHSDTGDVPLLIDSFGGSSCTCSISTDGGMCFSGEAVCGMQVRQQKKLGPGWGDNGQKDDTGINGLRFKCCDIPKIGELFRCI